jgi:predicted RNA methylase
MGITELPILRAALREFVQFRSNGPKVNRAKELERQLVGCKIPGFFPTPKSAVNRVVELACIENGMDILEPEAGSGNIAERIRLACPGANLSVIEINSTLRDILKEKGFNLVGQDFLDHRGEYDRIIMNPPFEQGADMSHIGHAYSLLRPRGRVVSICSEGPFFRNDKQSVEFRAWLDEVGGTTEDLESGTFMDRTQVHTTGVKPRIVVVDKRS